MRVTLSPYASSAQLPLPQDWHGSFIMIINGSTKDDPTAIFTFRRTSNGTAVVNRYDGIGLDVREFGDALRIVVSPEYVRHHDQEFNLTLLGNQFNLE